MYLLTLKFTEKDQKNVIELESIIFKLNRKLNNMIDWYPIFDYNV